MIDMTFAAKILDISENKSLLSCNIYKFFSVFAFTPRTVTNIDPQY